MKKKILCFLLSSMLVLTLMPSAVFADETVIFKTDFEDYEGNAAGTQNPVGFGGGTVAYEGPGSSYSGFFAVATDKGTSVSMESMAGKRSWQISSTS